MTACRAEDCVESIRCFAEHLGDRGRVEIHRDLESTVAEKVMDGAGMLTEGKERVV
jgi:hypothetical protein